MLGPSDERSIEQIFQEGKRHEEIQQQINEYLTVQETDAGVTLLFLDTRGSASSVVSDVGPRSNLQKLRARAQRLVSAAETLVLVGSPDQIYIVYVPHQPDQVLTDASQLLAAVPGAVVGISQTSIDQKNAFDLIWVAQQAAREARLVGNGVGDYAPSIVATKTTLLSSHQRVMIDLLGSYLGRNQQSLVREALVRLFNKHGDLWRCGVNDWLAQHRSALEEPTSS